MGEDVEEGLAGGGGGDPAQQPRQLLAFPAVPVRQVAAPDPDTLAITRTAQSWKT